MQNKSLKKYIRRLVLTLILIFLVLSFFIHPTKNNLNSRGYEIIDFKDNKYGLYLSSFRAEVMGDYFKLDNFYNEAVLQNGADFLGKSYIINSTKNNEEKAIKDAQEEIKKNQSNVIATIYLSYTDFKKGDYKAAYDKLNNVKNKSDTFLIKLLKGWVLMAQNKNDKAMDLLETEINNPAFESIVLMNLGVMAELSNDNSYAEELYEEALNTQINLFDIETIANFYLKQNRKQKAIDVVSGYCKKAPNSVSAVSLLKAIENDTYTPYYIDSVKKGMAKSLFDISNVIVSIFPSATDLYLMYINMILNLDDNIYMAQLMKAEIYKKYSKLNEYKTIIDKIPSTNYLYLINRINYAGYLLKQKKYKFEAISLYKDLIKENPTVLQLYQNLGDYYKENKDYNKAIDIYTDGIAQPDDNKLLKSELYFSRALCYDALKKTDLAKKDLEQAVVLNKKNPVILNYYAYFLLLNDQDLENAFKLAEQVIGFEPLNPYYLDTYGWAYFKLGKYKDALKMLEYAKTLQPKNSVIIDHLGDIYWKLGRKQEAKYEWQKALNFLDSTKANDGLNPTKLNKKINFGL